MPVPVPQYLIAALSLAFATETLRTKTKTARREYIVNALPEGRDGDITLAFARVGRLHTCPRLSCQKSPRWSAESK